MQTTKTNQDTARLELPILSKAGSKVGEKVGSGTVQWRFGAGVAKGELMPEQETDTMCYARTEKGNTKALGKGKDYWWKC